MKTKTKKILLVIIILVSLFSIVNIYQTKVKADSGWDSSYDSGGSSWSSSSSDWSYSSSSSSSDSDGEDAIIFVIVLLFVVIFVVIEQIRFTIIKSKIEAPDQLFNKTDGMTKEMTNEEIKNIVPDFDTEKFKKEAYENFVKIQKAWMNFDYVTLKRLCSNEIYNTYYEELEALKLKNGQNIMSDFELVNNKIFDIKEKNGVITVVYQLIVEFYDYVINDKTQKIVKGTDKRKMHNTYILIFTKSNNYNSICPNCGNSIEPGTTECSHCKAVIVQDSNEFVMSSKRIISQR